MKTAVVGPNPVFQWSFSGKEMMVLQKHWKET